jgi:PAS domain S-box-containing protein
VFGLSAALIVLVLIRGPRANARYEPIYWAGALCTLAQIWITNDLAMHSQVAYATFGGYKLFAIALAVFGSASLRVGITGIGLAGILPILELYQWPPAIRERVSVVEPWVTLLYAAVGMGVLYHRRRELRRQAELVQAQTKAAYVELFMRKFLAVRDLANSPLQAFEATLGVLRMKHPESKQQIDRLARQLDRLRKLTTVLAQYEPRAWTERDQSFDPLEVLQDLEGSPTPEFDRLFLGGPEQAAPPDELDDGGRSKVDQLLRFTSFGLEHSPISAFWLGEDGRLVYVNQAACESLGYRRSELLGMHISSFVPRIERSQWPERLEQFRQHSTRPYPSVHRRKDGTLIPVQITASYVQIGGRGYVLGFASDLVTAPQASEGTSQPAT